MNKFNLFFLFGLLLTLQTRLFAQQQADPVKLTYSVTTKSGNLAEVRIKATLDKGWHIYAQHQPKSAISVPTRIDWTKSPLWSASGSIREVGVSHKQEIKDAGIEQFYFKDSVTFVQMVRLRGNAKSAISGSITYQACTDEMCLTAKTVPFTIPVEQR